MNIRKNVFAAIIGLSFCLPASIRSETEFSIEPEFGYVFGETEYDMEVYGINPDTDSLIELRSLLEFPLDAYMTGVRIDYRIKKNNRQILSFELGFSTNITDTDRLFKDHDWWTGYVDSAGNVNNLVYFDGKFSYTESEMDLKNLIAELKIKTQVVYSNKLDVYVYLGYRHHDIDIEAFGYRGWQYDIIINKTMRKFDLYHPDTMAIIYRATYRTPFLGLQMDLRPAPRLNTSLNASVMMVFADDYDHHLLTRKDAVADGSHIGVGGGLGINYYFMKTVNRGVFAGLTGDIYYSSISGRQTQNLYEIGEVVSGIPHKFNVWQARLNLSIGYQF